MDKSKTIPTRRDIERALGNDPVLIRALEDLFQYANIDSEEEVEQLQSTIISSMGNINFYIIGKIKALNERLSILESQMGNVLQSKKKMPEEHGCSCNAIGTKQAIDLGNIKRDIETIKDFIGI